MRKDMGARKSTTGTQLARRGDRPPAQVPKRLVADLRRMIDESRQAVAQTVNTALVWLYWNIGRRIREDILQQKRAEYGEQIVATLSQQLAAEYGKGFSRFNLSRMVNFSEVYPDERIVSALSKQLSWSHFVLILPLDDLLQRDFYAEMCRIERWSVRTLQQKINGMLFERTALSRKPEKLARQELAALRDGDRLTPDLVFKDPYFLDFLGLKDAYAEKDFEAAILRGLILCAGKSDERVTLLRLNESGIRVAAYLTELPPRELLEKKLHEAVRAARARICSRGQ